MSESRALCNSISCYEYQQTLIRELTVLLKFAKTVELVMTITNELNKLRASSFDAHVIVPDVQPFTVSCPDAETHFIGKCVREGRKL